MGGVQSVVFLALNKRGGKDAATPALQGAACEGYTASKSDWVSNGKYDELRQLLLQNVHTELTWQILFSSRREPGDIRQTLSMLAGIIEPRLCLSCAHIKTRSSKGDGMESESSSQNATPLDLFCCHSV